jgi:m7GpppX diphosphatase
VRARVEERFLVRETGDMYRQALGPLAGEIRADGRSIQWVYNILEHKKESERIIFEDPDPATGFLLVPDPKWKTHPDPLLDLDRPNATWKHAPWTGQLACLAICHDRGIGSLRDLRRRHLPLLRNILAQGLSAIERVYGVEPERVRVFVHYVPQFFHFHGALCRVLVVAGYAV